MLERFFDNLPKLKYGENSIINLHKRFSCDHAQLFIITIAHAPDYVTHQSLREGNRSNSLLKNIRLEYIFNFNPFIRYTKRNHF